MNTPKYRILVLGAGGFGREVLQWIISYPESIQIPQDQWVLGGYLDDNLSALDDYKLSSNIVGRPLEFEYQPFDRLICAIADPGSKLTLCREIESRNGKFTNMICDSSILKRNNTIGRGVVVVPGAIITTNVRLGNFVTLNVYATVGHDAIIGDGCTLNGHTDVTGGVLLNEGVFMGSHACVTPSVVVGKFARIGAGSVVVRNVSPYTTVMGVPAKKIFTRTVD